MTEIKSMTDEEFEHLVAAFRNRGAPRPSIGHLSIDLRALIGAALVTAIPSQSLKYRPDAVTVELASELVNVSLNNMRVARSIMKNAPETIPSIKSGIRTLGTVFERIRKRGGRRPRPPDNNDSEFLDGEVWKQFRDAILLITGLPQAQDVVKIARLRDKSDVSTTRLNRAIKWLKEFEHEWGGDNAST